MKTTVKIKKSLKHLMYAMVASIAVLVGCQTIPSVDYISNMSKAIGYSTGMVANLTKIDDASRNAIVDIMNKVSMCVPETNQTFEAAWTPIAQAHTDQLVKEGKIDAKQGEIVMTAFKLVTKGIDYLFEVRFPKAKEYKDLTVAAIDGFTTGFLTMFKPADGAALSAIPSDYDEDAFEYLRDSCTAK